MIVLGRHRPLTQDAWSELAVRAAIEEIAADAISHFDPEGFWPGHPSDDGALDGNPSFYWGAAGGRLWPPYFPSLGGTPAGKNTCPWIPVHMARDSTPLVSQFLTEYGNHCHARIRT